MSTSWRLHLVAGALLVLAYPLLPAGPASAVYLVVGAGSVAAVVAGARAPATARPHPVVPPGRRAAGYEVGGAFDVMWLASYVLIGGAALHPSAEALTTAAEPTAPYSTRRMVALACAVLVAPGTLVAQLVLGREVDGWPIAVASTALFLLVVVRMDLAIRAIRSASQQGDRLRERLAHLASHDPLTELANRARTVEEIRAALHRACRSGLPVGLLFVDLDHFKDVNDLHGHATGDELLRETARRITATVRAGDVVGRLGVTSSSCSRRRPSRRGACSPWGGASSPPSVSRWTCEAPGSPWARASEWPSRATGRRTRTG